MRLDTYSPLTPHLLPTYSPLTPTYSPLRHHKLNRSVKLLLLAMYIYHALINPLSVHMKHIDLNMIFLYTHGAHMEHSPIKTTHTKHHTKHHTERQTTPPLPHTHTNHSELKCVCHWSVLYTTPPHPHQNQYPPPPPPPPPPPSP